MGKKSAPDVPDPLPRPKPGVNVSDASKNARTKQRQTRTRQGGVGSTILTGGQGLASILSPLTQGNTLLGQ